MYSSDEIFNRSELLLGSKVMQRLADTRIIVFGLGGVGSWCAEGLIRSGIGHLTIVDADCVAPSNINRQLPALQSTVGIPKTEAMLNRLRDINPEADILAINTFYSQVNAHLFPLHTYHYVIDAIDALSPKATLILQATNAHTTIFSSMGAALKTSAGLITVDEFWKVKGCPLARALRNKFRRAGTLPSAKFKCVYSPELVPNKGTSDESCSYKAAINGSLVHITATFGFRLVSLVIEDILKTTCS